MCKVMPTVIFIIVIVAITFIHACFHNYLHQNHDNKAIEAYNTSNLYRVYDVITDNGK